MKKKIISHPLMLLTTALVLAPPELLEFMNSPEEQARMDEIFEKMTEVPNESRNEEKTENQD